MQVVLQKRPVNSDGLFLILAQQVGLTTASKLYGQFLQYFIIIFEQNTQLLEA